jgi:hypothetical protein
VDSTGGISCCGFASIGWCRTQNHTLPNPCRWCLHCLRSSFS